MVLRGPESISIIKVIGELEKAGRKNECKLWNKCAEFISLPTRRRVQVNLYKLEKFAQDGKTLVVPGKVLGIGEVSKKFNIVAFQLSAQAVEKLEKAKCKVLTFEEAIKANPKGTGLVLLV